jgi:hypothetical protein
MSNFNSERCMTNVRQSHHFIVLSLHVAQDENKIIPQSHHFRFTWRQTKSPFYRTLASRGARHKHENTTMSPLCRILVSSPVTPWIVSRKIISFLVISLRIHYYRQILVYIKGKLWVNLGERDNVDTVCDFQI